MKPILFNTEMVQAILEKRKTQTRRPVKGEALKWLEDGFLPSYVSDPENSYFHRYKVGEILWVRETWVKNENPQSPNFGKIEFRADYEGSHAKELISWKPSIHMPFEACRLFLKVTNVRIERLQDITVRDVKAEGCSEIRQMMLFGLSGEEIVKLYRDRFGTLWQKINGAASWERNDWVWVYDFEKTEKPEV